MALAKEPPVVASAIPYFGHAIGLMRGKFNYYVQLSHQTNDEIFTMVIPGQKMYIVTTLELTQAIQKHPKTLAFPPIEAKVANRICGSSAKAQRILDRNVNGDEGDWGLSMESYAQMRAALAPGAGLDMMNRIMIQNTATFLNGLIPSGEKQVQIGLAEWLRYAVTIATTNSVYGPKNPFKDSEIFKAFWEFESEIGTLLVGILPSITVRKGIAARTKVVKALTEYFRAEGHKQGSDLVNGRLETALSNGLTVEDFAPYEVGGSFAVLVNTAPAVFWMIFLVYSYPSLFSEIRAEVEPIMSISRDDGLVRSLDITSLKQSCPLLTSTFQEVLRFRSMGTSVRQVMEDTILQDKWLLKKDCMIQMPSQIIHTSSAIWGDDVNEFNPRRFLRDGQLGKRPNAAAFRAFGGGTTLCPGRHFATNEVLAVFTMFVMRFDLTPCSGEWSLPTTHNTNMASVVMTPDNDIEVQVSLRKGYEDGTWAFRLKDSEKVFAMVAEDKEW